MTSEPNKPISIGLYWFPTGYQRAPEPEPYTKAWQDKDSNGWKKQLENADYEVLDWVGEAYDTEWTLYVHDNGHLLVEMDNAISGAHFFVNPEDSDEFMVTRWVELGRETALANSLPYLAKLVKTLAAFVRHEHGEHVIDEEGERNLEDDQQALRRSLERKRLKQEQEAKDKTTST